MMQEPSASLLSMKQLTSILDHAPVAVYVSAIGTWELLYANRRAEELFLHDSCVQGHTCYQVAGFKEQCPYCQAEKMNSSELFVREFTHPGDGRVYQLSGMIIDWAGKPAHIEYIQDITEKKKEEEQTLAAKEELLETFRSIPCGLCVYRLEEGKIYPVFHNPAFYEIMGYSDEHVLSLEQETTFLGVHPEDVALLKEKIGGTIRTGRPFRHTYRLWNDRQGKYCFIKLEGSLKRQKDGLAILYGVYSDVSEQVRLEKELTGAYEKMQDIINAIPGGVAIYKVSNIFETVYFSDGVPELSGYTVEEYRELMKEDAAKLTYPEDSDMVVGNLRRAIREHKVAEFDFRKQHRDGHIVWVHIQAKQIGEEGGFPLIHCVFHNISALKETQLEMDHLVNSIPGGIASYRVEGDRFIPTFYSDGVMALSGHTREELKELVRDNALNVIYEQDRGRVLASALEALSAGTVLDTSYRMRHKDGNLIWIHINGRRMGPQAESMRFYAVFTGLSAESRLFQGIADESADGIYVIDKNNYDLLYVNESDQLFTHGKKYLGQKCYQALHGNDAPCEFCTLQSHKADGKEHEMAVKGADQYFSTRFREMDWNGIPAYIKYVRNTTEEVKTRKEKERLEQYFQTVVKNLPGGIAVVLYGRDGSMTPEYLSDGFAKMTGMKLEGAWRLYRQDAMAGVHPDDRKSVKEQMDAYLASGDDRCEIIYRLKKGQDGYLWVRNTLSLIQSEGGKSRVYAVYHDITKERQKQEEIRRQYNELIIQHYRTPGPNALIIGHCNITQNRILEIIDHTDSNLLKTFGTVREEFFTGISRFIVDEQERAAYLNIYLNAPALAAFERNETEQVLECFVKLPQELRGRYVQIKMNMVATPGSGDVTGILTVTDITEQKIGERILHRLSVTGYDFVADVDLEEDCCKIISQKESIYCAPPKAGRFSEWAAYMYRFRVVPRDKEQYKAGLDPENIKKRLKDRDSYTFAFSIADDNGDVRTKNITVSAVDLRLGRVCLSRTDITDSIREQQGLLNMIAYTFELAGFIELGSGRLTLYTRETVLKSLPPYEFENYKDSIRNFIDQFGAEESKPGMQRQFQMETMLEQLEKKPGGYEFLFSSRAGNGERYKQINVLWGEVNHRTICLVRADVTDMLAAERQTKKELENALALAKEANRAKSDFLSAMSHDIRTPMNAIMGMTALASLHLDDRRRVADCLEKISLSSKHLLSLINDVLDMSKIERSNITLNRIQLSLPKLLAQLSSMLASQAKAAGLQFDIHTQELVHGWFYGDSLRINQILINILSNAIKFTPAGGRVDFLTEEIPPLKEDGRVRYRFTIRDTGIGMSQEFLTHIFDPFTRSNTASQVEGTGLGLSITKGLVDLMGGKISVETELEKGTSFRVELEFEACEREEELPGDGADIHPGLLENGKMLAGRRFLVAEDNDINAEILSELLELYGAESVVMTDGAQAVRAFCESSPGTYDAILMDIQMPELNGYEATRAIRKLERPDAREIPIVAMTANAFAEDVQAALDAGMNTHVAKPIDIEVLQGTLCRILEDSARRPRPEG